MKASRKKDTITIQLSVEEAALLAANIASSREPAMTELYERLLGSPTWKRVRQPASAHPGVIDEGFYNATLERHAF